MDTLTRPPVGLDLESKPTYETDRLYPNFEPTQKKVDKRLRDHFDGKTTPVEGSTTGSGYAASFYKFLFGSDETGTNLKANEKPDLNGLPKETVEAMQASFRELVKAGKLKQYHILCSDILYFDTLTEQMKYLIKASTFVCFAKLSTAN